MIGTLLAELRFADLWNADGAWIVATAAATNAACAIVGSFLVLRRMSLMGDALSHAVLPGLAIAFILARSYSLGPLLIGAVAAGLLTTFLTQTLHEYAGVPSDASMGVVFTALFALGVVLIHRGISGVHFDTCIYQGSLETAPLYTIEAWGRHVPRAFVAPAAVGLLNLAIVGVLWKEFKLSAFDPALATTMGFSAGLMHYLLMAMVAVTSVASFEAVGSILVVAMLIVPPATAHLLVDRLAPMMVVAVLCAVLSAVLGYVLGVWLDTNLAGMMTVAASGLYAMAVLFSPRYGLVSNVVGNLRTSLRVVREDLLAMLYRVEELGATQQLALADARRAVGGGLLARWGLRALLRGGQLSAAGQQVQLTAAGREEARRMVRTHRLWETFLVRHLGMPLDHVHEPANRVEHYISGDLRERLQAKLEATDLDPHGRRIPE
ncbi:MAG TPA: metal ABC transporter permease [Lacipirellulaceae bacterium]|nr:metal ABC transporter permease [Lacipirellulaceae bacterium]